MSATDPAPPLDEADRALLARYVKAFEQYDIEALTSLIQEDATQSMPPFDLWLRGRDDILTWWFGPGIGCQGSRVIPTVSANGSPAFGQYKPSETGGGYEPWALQVLELSGGRIVEFTFFLDTDDALPALRPARPARRRSTSCRPANASSSRSSRDASRRRSSSRAAARRAGAGRARRLSLASGATARARRRRACSQGLGHLEYRPAAARRTHRRRPMSSAAAPV